MNDRLGLINWLSKCHRLQWLADWWIDFLTERLTDWVTCWLNDQNNDLFTCCMTDLLAYLLTDQLTESFTNSYWLLTDWLAHWLTYRLLVDHLIDETNRKITDKKCLSTLLYNSLLCKMTRYLLTNYWWNYSLLTRGVIRYVTILTDCLIS